MATMTVCAILTAVRLTADGVPPEVEIVPVVGQPSKVVKFFWKDDAVGGVEHLGKGERKSWPLADALGIRFPAQPAPAANGLRAWTTAGDALVVTEIKSMSDEKVELRGAAFGEWSAPPARMRGLLLDPQATGATVEKVRQWLDKPRAGDAVLYRNGDESSGTLVGIDDKAVEWKVEAVARRAPRDQILAAAFDPQLAEKSAPKDVHVIATLVDGTTLRLSRLEWPTAGVRNAKAKTSFGDALEIDSQALLSVSVRGGRAVFLSDLQPLRSTVAPFLDGGRRIANDRNAVGGPLRLAGKNYDKGIGVVSRSSLTYSAKEWKRFDAEIGLDDAAGPLGSVRFLVRVDGAVAFDSGEMRPGDKPKTVGVELTGKREIELFVDYEKRGDVDDLADWCEARFVR